MNLRRAFAVTASGVAALCLSSCALAANVATGVYGSDGPSAEQSSSAPSDATADPEVEGADDEPLPGSVPDSEEGAGTEEPHEDVRPAPAGAIELEARPGHPGDESVAVLVAPSRNIGCELTESGGGCGVVSYASNPPSGVKAGEWWMSLESSGPPSLASRGDVRDFEKSAVNPFVLEYGRSATFGSFACTSERSGMTCWNTKTGHGAKMSREAFEAF